MLTPSQARYREEWLREEIRENRRLMHNLMQWGITVLAAAELNLYYIRRDAYRYLVSQKALRPDELLPFTRWFVGTLFLLMLSVVFSWLMRRAAIRHRAWRLQLRESDYTGITDGLPASTRIGVALNLLFFVFPLFDVFLWAMFYVGSRLGFKVSIPW